MKKKQIILIGSLLVGTLIAGVAISLSWFDTRTDLNPDEIYGSSETAYFAYGKGTADEPYGITNPRHLYNLAWLQYMGKFNKDTDGDGVINPVYFELGNDIDMSKFSGALPPIGTVENPFVGVFNGNEKTISNLSISSENSDLTKKPYVVSSSFSSPNIIGMFGVVGEIEGTSYNLSYDSSVLSIKDFQLENATIKTGNANALIGIVAGYVNGSISDVTLVTPKMEFSKNTKNLSSYNAKFTHVSNYSVAGYCEEEYEKTITSTVTTLKNNVEDPIQFTKEETGDGQGWGGSIEMETMYNTLKAKWNVFTSSAKDTATKYTTSSSVTYDMDGKKNETATGTDVVQVASGALSTDYIYNQKSDNNYIRFYQSEDSDGGDTTSSYTFVIENPDSAKTDKNEFRYMCLTGYGKRAIKNGKTVTYTNKKQTNTFLISYEDGDNNKHYLGYDSTNSDVIDTTSTNAISFYLSSEGYLLTSLAGSDNYPRYYYLKNDDGLLTLEEYSSYVTPTIWTYDDGAQTFCDGFYYLMCAKDEEESSNAYYWSLDENQDAVKYQFYITVSSWFSQTTYYLNASNSSITASESSNTDWYLDNSNYIYTMINGTKFYVQGSNSRNNVSFTLMTSSSLKCLKYDADNKTLSCIPGKNNETYYLTFNFWSSAWNLSNSSTQINANKIVDYGNSYGIKYDTAGKTIYLNDTSSETVNSEFETRDTYFPLSNTNGVPNQKNTGYVVSGSNYFDDAYGDIRVSKFNITDLESFDTNTNALTSVYTVKDGDASLDITDSKSYIKYEKSKQTLEGILNGQDSVYGLHFMKAQIGTEYSDGHQVVIPKAVVNGTTYTNYQVPYDCIDFNLKDKGYINFFAGTYYTGNNSFFSLYKIDRDSNNKIIKINRISKIYEPKQSKDPYIYEYDDGTMTSGTKNSDTPIFNTAWIEKNDSIVMNKAYYFEIPVNEGEYALGSVSGANGAYLIYLDIGANAQVVNRTTVRELVKETRSTYKYAVGISIIKAGSTSGTEDVNSYCILIEDISSSSGSEITFDRESNDSSSTAKVTYTNEATISCDYKKDSLDLTINGQTAGITPLSSEVKTTSRLTYYDYVLNDGTTQVYKLDKVEGFDGNSSSEDQYYVIDADGNKGENQDEYTVYDNDGKKIESPMDITIDVSSTSLIYEFLLEDLNGDTTNYTITVEASGSVSTAVDESTGFYQYVLDGYTFTVSSEEETTATVSVKKTGENTYTITINGEDMTSKTEVTITISKASD